MLSSLHWLSSSLLSTIHHFHKAFIFVGQWKGARDDPMHSGLKLWNWRVHFIDKNRYLMSSMENERSGARTRVKPAVWSKQMSEPWERTIEPCEQTIEPCKQTIEPCERTSEPCERTSEPCERTNKPFLHRTARTRLKNVLCEDRLAKSLLGQENRVEADMASTFFL